MTVLGVSVVLALLPGLVAVGVAAGVGPMVAAALASLVAVVGGVKLAAVGWGLVSRVVARAPEEPVAA